MAADYMAGWAWEMRVAETPQSAICCQVAKHLHGRTQVCNGLARAGRIDLLLLMPNHHTSAAAPAIELAPPLSLLASSPLTPAPSPLSSPLSSPPVSERAGSVLRSAVSASALHLWASSSTVLASVSVSRYAAYGAVAQWMLCCSTGTRVWEREVGISRRVILVAPWSPPTGVNLTLPLLLG